MKITLMFFLLSISFTSYAQNDAITIEFKSKKVIRPTKQFLKNNNFVKIIVTDLPSGNYRVSINKIDSFLKVGNPPALFEVLNSGSAFNSLLDGLSAYTTYAETKNLDYLEINSPTKPISQKITFTQKINNTDSQKDQEGNLTTILYEQIMEMRKQIFDFHFSFRDEIIDSADNLKYLVNLDGDYNHLQFRNYAESIIKKKLAKEKQLEQMFLSYYDTILQIKNYAVLKSNPALLKGDSMIVSYKRNFNIFLNHFDSSFNRVVISKIYKQLKQPKIDTFISFPYRLQGDITKFDVSITAIDPIKTPQSYTSTIELNKYPRRLLSFTSGVFVSGLRNNDYAILTNVKQSQINPSQFDTSYSVFQENNNNVSTGINALMHIGSYFGDYNEIGGFLAFGPGLTFERKPQVRLMLGGGLMFGRTNKLGLSFGWSGGSVKRLSGLYNTGDNYKSAPKNIIRDQFESSWFVSIGYSLFNR